MKQRTLCIIKPDAVRAKKAGAILARLEKDFDLVALTKRTLTADQAAAFYAVHRERPFFGDLTAFMTSGPVVPVVLEGEDAVAHYRALMGATDSRKAAPGTLRAEFGTDNQANAVHGSDSPENAAHEIAFFFPDLA